MQVIFATYNRKYLHCTNTHRQKSKSLENCRYEPPYGYFGRMIEDATISIDEATISEIKATIAFPFQLSFTTIALQRRQRNLQKVCSTFRVFFCRLFFRFHRRCVFKTVGYVEAFIVKFKALKRFFKL